MNNKFDELTKNLAQSVTRRTALKKFGVGLAGMALACFGLANKAQANGLIGHAARGAEKIRFGLAGSHYQSCFNSCMHNCVGAQMAQGYTKAQATQTCSPPCTAQCSF
jgi:hypothetical protein